MTFFRERRLVTLLLIAGLQLVFSASCADKDPCGRTHYEGRAPDVTAMTDSLTQTTGTIDCWCESRSAATCLLTLYEGCTKTWGEMSLCTPEAGFSEVFGAGSETMRYPDRPQLTDACLAMVEYRVEPGDPCP